MAKTPTGTLTRWVILLPVFVVALVVLSTAGYMIIEQRSLFDGLYMTIITVTTVGSYSLPEMTAAGRWWTLGVVIGGVGLVAATFSVSVAALTEGTIHKALGRRQVLRAIERLNGHTIVCGFGRMGSMVVDSLQAAGREVVVVDQRADLFDRPETGSALHVVGDAQDEATLAAAGIERAAHLVTCLPDDADNVFLTLTARQMNPDLRVVARAEQPSTESKLRHAGATRVICPQIIGASRMVNLILKPAVADFFEMASKGVDLEMEQLLIGPKSPLAGRTLRELALPTKTGATVVAVLSAEGKTTYNPSPDYSIVPGDTLILVGRKGSATAVQKLQDAGGEDPEAQDHTSG